MHDISEVFLHGYQVVWRIYEFFAGLWGKLCGKVGILVAESDNF